MGWESLLLLFDRGHPVWDLELIRRAGEDPAGVYRLTREGLLEPLPGGAFRLTPRGAMAFREVRGQFFLDQEPGEDRRDPDRWLERNRLEWALRGAFVGRWGKREFVPGAALPFEAPDLAFRVDGGRVRWSPGEAGKGELQLDLLVLSRYDFASYLGHLEGEDSSDALANADRLLMVLEDGWGLEEACRALAMAHRWIRDRRARMGSRFDLDAEGQDSLTWWVAVTRDEARAAALRELLCPFGEDLARPSVPVDLWVVSREALEGVRGEETFFDLFARVGHRIFASRGRA
jgi:hypothetical protein